MKASAANSRDAARGRAGRFMQPISSRLSPPEEKNKLMLIRVLGVARRVFLFGCFFLAREMQVCMAGRAALRI